MDGEQPRDTIPINLRLLMVLEEVARVGAPVAPTEINAALELPKPTIHRLFATLEEEGFLQRDMDGRSYSPGPRMRVLAASTLSSLRIRTARQAILTHLSGEIGETCNIALPDRDAMIYLERVETEWPLRIQLPPGTRVPFHCTASGKLYLSSLVPNHLQRVLNAIVLERLTDNTITDSTVLLGELRRIAADGYALDREEFMPSMVALAVPILDPNGRLMATLAFHAPTQRFDAETVIQHLDALRHASDELAQLIPAQTLA